MNKCGYCDKNYSTSDHHCLKYFKLIKKRKHIKKYRFFAKDSIEAKTLAKTPRSRQATIAFTDKIIIPEVWPPLFAGQELSEDLKNFGDPNGEKCLNSILQEMHANGKDSSLQVDANISVISARDNKIVLKALPEEIFSSWTQYR